MLSHMVKKTCLVLRHSTCSCPQITFGSSAISFALDTIYFSFVSVVIPCERMYMCLPLIRGKDMTGLIVIRLQDAPLAVYFRLLIMMACRI